MTDSDSGQPSSENQEARIDQLCDRFEKDFRAGQRPRIEFFLATLPAELHPVALREMLSVECELLAAARQPIDDEDYRQRFPAHVAIVDEILRKLADSPTLSATPTSLSVGSHADEPDPVSIGRYQIVGRLGVGGFGRVYLAKDTKLGRWVAIKRPKKLFFEAGNSIEEFLREAEIAAKLKHPGLVQVYDYDVQLEEGRPYIVQEYIDGPDLFKWKQKARASREQIVTIFIEVTEAVGHLHQHSLIHRDLKPGNILVDSNGHAHVADFGLAVHESMQSRRKDERAGTESYMSPELHRGETHLLDGRSDLWSLGVIFYELLVGRRPFIGTDLKYQILTLDPKPLRQLDCHVPKELERICLKCLQKRRADRYGSAADLLEDLRVWNEPKSLIGPAIPTLIPPNAPNLLTRILPKGLRSFDEYDKDFFLELLPGARDRDGIPESIRFWRTRIEEPDPDKTFSVGLIYGPSGCGKSSLVKAGVLPNLASHVVSVYVEATPDDTELRLLKGLKKQLPNLADGGSLPDTLRRLRERSLGGGRKLLIVLDQFEQWLQAHGSENGSQLVDALRQSDGGNVQCLVLVRGEFLFAATMFMRAVDTKLIEGFNSNPVDLFDPGHAYKVLEAFGRTHGRLPADPTLTTSEQRAFLDEAVNALADNGRINCVRLALFWEMMKGRTWTPTNLRHLGGVEGVEAAFLEDRFASDTAPPTYRFHQQAARAVLHRFLPESGGNIRGDAQSYSELLKSSGYVRPQELEELLHILDGETRLITPCDRAVRSSDPREENGSSADERYYQLTHEFLIPPLRQWLTRKKRETRRGRAELDLETLTADWNARPDRRPLPTMTEWLRLRLLTKPHEWTAAQKGMMASADRRHLSRVGASIAFTLLLAWMGLEIWRREHTQGLVSNLAIADTTNVSKAISECDAAGEKSPKIYELALEKLLSQELPMEGKINVQLFLVKRHLAYTKPLIDHLLSASPDEHQVILARLADAVPNLAEELWPALRGNALRPNGQLRAACALAALDSANQLWQEQAQQVSLALIRCEQREHVPKWIAGLVPVGQHLVPLLAERFRSEHFIASEQWIVAAALAQFLRSETEQLADLLPYSTAESFPVLLNGLTFDRDQALKVLDRLSRKREEGKSDKERAFRERGKAIAAIARLRLDAHDDFWSVLDAEEDPDFRTAVVDLCAPLGVEPNILLDRLDVDRVKPSTKYTIILSLAEYLELSAGSDELHDAIRKRCMGLHGQDPDSGVHFATEYVLKLLQPTNEPQATGNQQAQVPVAAANWKVTPQGISMVVIRGPQDFVLGSPESETEREDDMEHQRKVHLNHSFEIGAYEVTVEQFRKYGLFTDTSPATKVSTSGEDPMSNVNWYDAAKFCRRLSEADEKMKPTEYVYPEVEEIRPGMELSVDWRTRTGYRLPTEEEWECACRAGTTTARFFGRLHSRLGAYGRYNANSNDKLWPVGNLRPNPWGLFDTYGNVLEWCHSPRELLPPEPKSGESPAAIAARSGYYRSIARENRSAKTWLFSGNQRQSYYGLRVARTILD